MERPPATRFYRYDGSVLSLEGCAVRRSADAELIAHPDVERANIVSGLQIADSR